MENIEHSYPELSLRRKRLISALLWFLTNLEEE
jgi:hypothetical protein